LESREPVVSFVGNPTQDFFKDFLILLGLQGAGGVDEEAAGSEAIEGIAEDEGLAAVEIGEVFGKESPFDFGVAGEGAGARAGSVDEDSIEGAAKGEGAGGVKADEGAAWVRLGTEAVEVEIAGNGADSEFEGMGGLVAGRGAKVEEGEARAEVE
jgi:hypothetical protein